MKKVTLKDSKGNEINDIMKDVLTFDCETTGLPPKGAKWDVDFAEFPNIVQLACIIELKPKQYPAEQLKFNPEPAKTKKVKREVLVHDPKPPDAEPENKVAKLLNETDF